MTTWRENYPFDSQFLDLNGHRYHFLDEGQGSPMLMVHGNPTWSFYWRNLITACRDGMRCIAPDHMGCGLSDKPADYPYRLQQHIANLRRLIQHLDLSNITLVVHDWGGAIGLGAALAEPDRIARIVLLNTGAFPPPYVPWRIRLCRTPGLGRLAVQGFNAFARAALWMATEKPARMTPPVKAGLLAPYDCWSHRVAVYRFVADIPLTRRHETWPVLEQIEAGLPQLADRPVQIIWGMKDWCFTPVCLERFVEVFPHADVQHLADAGHYVMEDAHERVVPLIREFLNRETAAPTARE